MAILKPARNGVAVHQLEKEPTGIKGLDEILEGGLPKGRTTLVCGAAGCGKTLLGIEFLARGINQYDEPGVLIIFEESPEEVTANVASLGIDFQDLIERKKLMIDYVRVERSEIEETGDYDLEGLFIRLADAIQTVGAKRVVLDTIESLFAGLSNEAILRAELRRLFHWLKDQGVTTIITGERGEGTLTRNGLEEYVSDCVILLDHRVNEGIATRLLRVVKYRGSKHGNDEYPFLVDEQGIWVMPVTSVGLNYTASCETIPTGIPRLDTMLGGKGYYRGSSIMISGTAGSGKTSVAAHLVDAACRRGERCIYFAYEESPSQIIRNMRSIGLDLEQWVQQGLLRFHAVRPSLYGVEMHLLTMQKLVDEFQPSVAVVDPVNNLHSIASDPQVKSMLLRMIDFFKSHAITALFISLTAGGEAIEQSNVGVSSLMDTWLLLNSVESNGERNRVLYLLKSRGMSHSNQMREFLLTDQGVELVDVYVGPQGVLTGAARLAQAALEKSEAEKRQLEVERKKSDLERKHKAMQAQIEALQAEYQAEAELLLQEMEQGAQRDQERQDNRQDMARARWADQSQKQAS